MNPTIQISIAVVTRNRPFWLYQCLESWQAQTIKPFEIVVSDDSDDAQQVETRRVVEGFGARWVAGPRRGLYANRNSVVRYCRGTHVFSADDDHEHPPDFLEKCLLVQRQDPSAAWCVGEAMSWEEAANGWISPGELRLRGAPRPPADPDQTWAWADGATLFPKEIFDRDLCFYDGFRFGSAYLEFGCLLHAVGQKIRLMRGTGFIHHMRSSGRSFELPIEEWASTYFALIMLAWVYQPSVRHRLKNLAYFLRQSVGRPLIFLQAFPRALRAVRERRGWYSRWLVLQTDQLSPSSAEMK